MVAQILSRQMWLRQLVHIVYCSGEVDLQYQSILRVIILLASLNLWDWQNKAEPLKGPRSRAQVVCDFCEAHLEANKAAFADPRFQLVVDDARAQLEKWPGTFDVIVGDLADPVYGGPCYQVGLC